MSVRKSGNPDPKDDVSSHTSDPQRSGDSSNKSDEDVYDTADEEVQQTSAEKAGKKLHEEVIKLLERQRAHGPPLQSSTPDVRTGRPIKIVINSSQ